METQPSNRSVGRMLNQPTNQPKIGYIVDDKLVDLVQEINGLARKFHNTDLTQNKNVHKIWTDGIISIEDGGENYGHGTIWIIFQYLYHKQVYNRALKFPHQYYKNNEESFAIVTLAHAKIVREKIRSLMNSTFDLHPELFPQE